MAVVMDAKRGSSQSASAPADAASQTGTGRRGRPSSKPADDSSAQKLAEPDDFLEDDDIMLADDDAVYEDDFGDGEEEDVDEGEDDVFVDEDEEVEDAFDLDDDGEDDEYEEEEEEAAPVPGQVPFEPVLLEEALQRLADARKGAQAATVDVVPEEQILAEAKEAEEARQAALALPGGCAAAQRFALHAQRHTRGAAIARNTCTWATRHEAYRHCVAAMMHMLLAAPLLPEACTPASQHMLPCTLPCACHCLLASPPIACPSQFNIVCAWPSCMQPVHSWT